MPAITIRNVPTEVRDELAARAAARGQSLQTYLLELLTDTTDTPHPDTWLTDLRARVRQRGGTVTREDLLADKDADRR